MKKKFFVIAICLLFLTYTFTSTDLLKNVFGSRTAYAVGDLSVDWGVPEGQPIFTFSGFYPGQQEVHLVKISNGSTLVRPVGVKGIETFDDGNLSNVLIITISLNGSAVYGPKTLSQFFSDSNGDGVGLGNLNPGQFKNFEFKVLFDPSAGNAFQNKTEKFDLKIGVAIPVPVECSGIVFTGSPIFGTQGANVLNGTSGNDLIFGLEGSDVINGNGGNDCIVGGNGADSLSGGAGSDVILGGNDSDLLRGGVGDDKLFGEGGADSLMGEDGDDELSGGDASDQMIGGNGNDKLNGGNGLDSGIGGVGIDSCVAESRVQCEL